MQRSSAIILFTALALSASFSTPAAAQTPETPKYEVSALPGGVVVFTDAGTGETPGFAGYALAGTFTFNVNRFIGIEGEFGGNIGVEQDLEYFDDIISAKPPHQVSYSGNVIYHVGGAGRSITPYVIGGVGGLHVYERAAVGVTDPADLFTVDVGGGVKFRVGGHWGVRADYRFLTAYSADDAPAFFGGSDRNRYGHRITGGLTFGFGS